MSGVDPKQVEQPSPEALALWTRRFATLVSVGVSLVRCLLVLEEEPTSGPLGEITHRIRREIEDGRTLFQAMGKLPQVFDSDYVGSVRCGEVGGIIHLTLSRWAEVLERRLDLRRRPEGTDTREQLAEWCWRFGHVYAASAPSLDSAKVLAESVRSPLREITANVAQEINMGAHLGEPLQKYPAFFPPMLLQVVGVSGDAPSLQYTFKALAAHFDKEAVYEAAGVLPPLWTVGMRVEVEEKKEHPVVAQVNNIFIAAFQRESEAISFGPSGGGKGSAVLYASDKPDESIAIEEYDRAVRRVKILAAIDPFSREVRNSQIHLRWEGKDFTAHVTSRPSPTGDRLYLKLTPMAVLEAG